MPKLHIKKEDTGITLLDEQSIQKKFNNLSTVATTGDYTDLSNKPNIFPTEIILDNQSINHDGFFLELPSTIITLSVVTQTINFGNNVPTMLMKGLNGSYMTINLGDGTIESLSSGKKIPTHTYASSTLHDVIISGYNITSIGAGTFITSNGQAFESISIPPNITNIQSNSINVQSLLSTFTYQLYWKGDNIITYDSNKIPTADNTTIIIPYGEEDNYIAKGYPSDKIQEREE